MPLRLVFCLLTALALGIAPTLAAQSDSADSSARDPGSEAGFTAAEALYNAGHYQEAVTAAEALETPDGLALAARSRLVLVRFFMAPGDRHAAIETALADARRALVLDPTHLEANLQAAIALGYRGKLNRSIRDAKAGKRHIDEALVYHPTSGWALATLGGWNGEVVLEAGRFFASALFGAGRNKAVRSFRAAVAAEPENIAIRAGFAKTLLRFNRSRFEKEALALLEDSITLPAHTAFEKMMMQQMHDLLMALQAGEREALKNLLEKMAAFADQ